MRVRSQGACCSSHERGSVCGLWVVGCGLYKPLRALCQFQGRNECLLCPLSVFSGSFHGQEEDLASTCAPRRRRCHIEVQNLLFCKANSGTDKTYRLLEKGSRVVRGLSSGQVYHAVCQSMDRPIGGCAWLEGGDKESVYRE